MPRVELATSTGTGSTTWPSARPTRDGTASASVHGSPRPPSLRADRVEGRGYEIRGRAGRHQHRQRAHPRRRLRRRPFADFAIGDVISLGRPPDPQAYEEIGLRRGLRRVRLTRGGDPAPGRPERARAEGESGASRLPDRVLGRRSGRRERGRPVGPRRRRAGRSVRATTWAGVRLGRVRIVRRGRGSSCRGLARAASGSRARAATAAWAPRSTRTGDVDGDGLADRPRRARPATSTTPASRPGRRTS